VDDEPEMLPRGGDRLVKSAAVLAAILLFVSGARYLYCAIVLSEAYARLL
jgi:hypothetical protein